MSKIRVLVADDHTIVRHGIYALLGLMSDIELVGEAVNGKDALEKVEKLMPDVVIMDIAMPLMDGLEATRRICKEFPKTKVIALTQYDDREFVFPVIEAGARGFISKTAASSELASAIRSVYRGDSYLSPSVARVFVEGYQQGIDIVKEHDPYRQLTNWRKVIPLRKLPLCLCSVQRQSTGTRPTSCLNFLFIAVPT
jgi:DNA-binding NarL/FixJ family response regulator